MRKIFTNNEKKANKFAESVKGTIKSAKTIDEKGRKVTIYLVEWK